VRSQQLQGQLQKQHSIDTTTTTSEHRNGLVVPNSCVWRRKILRRYWRKGIEHMQRFYTSLSPGVNVPVHSAVTHFHLQPRSRKWAFPTRTPSQYKLLYYTGRVASVPKHHVMKTYGGMEVRLPLYFFMVWCLQGRATFLFSLVDYFTTLSVPRTI
jgi:hypothetical protein